MNKKKIIIISNAYDVHDNITRNPGELLQQSMRILAGNPTLRVGIIVCTGKTKCKVYSLRHQNEA